MKAKYIGMAVLLAVLSASCQKDLLNDRAGKPVVFSASSDLDPVTKTAYSGEVVGGRERIDWVNGDPVEIFMYTEGISNSNERDITSATYSVVNIQAQNEKSVGKVAASGDALVWKEGRKHSFYSCYPASAGTGFNNNAGDNNRYFSFTLPSSQSGGMENAFMAATAQQASYTTEGKGSVVLEYYPMVTTLYVTITNSNKSMEPISVSKLRLKKDNWPPIAGTYKAYLSGNKYIPDGDNAWDTSQTITVSSSATINYGESETFLVFLLPRNNINPAELKLTLFTGKGPQTISLENSAISNFASCKKYNLNLTLEESGINITDFTETMIELIRCCHPDGNTWGSVEDIARKLREDEDIQIKVKEWIMTTKTLSSQQGVRYTYNITSDDLKQFPNLTTIDYLDLADGITVNIDGMDNLTSMSFNHGHSFTVKNCLNLNSFNTKNNESVVLFEFENCENLAEFNNDNTGHKAVYSFKDMPILKRINVPDAESLIASDCPVLETITMSNAVHLKELSVTDNPVFKRFDISNAGSNLTNINLVNTPKFEGGSAGNNLNNLAVTLINCSTDISWQAKIDIQNSQISNITVTRDDASSNVVVSANGGQK